MLWVKYRIFLQGKSSGFFFGRKPFAQPPLSIALTPQLSSNHDNFSHAPTPYLSQVIVKLDEPTLPFNWVRIFWTLPYKGYDIKKHCILVRFVGTQYERISLFKQKHLGILESYKAKVYIEINWFTFQILLKEFDCVDQNR